ncbi:MAG: GTPase HflX, partial [Planctomycetes bacterium]|nr:GTPase HflX [Planctomycetota bacterium]
MYETERSQSVAREKTILVRVVLPEHPYEDEPLEELEGLASTAGARIVSGLLQRRERPDASTYLGKGKVDELKNLVE